MTRIFVKLNRILGNGNNEQKRFDDDNIYEMIIPVKTGPDQFEMPLSALSQRHVMVFSKYLLEGQVILINQFHGWNYLRKTDQIIEIYTKD